MGLLILDALQPVAVVLLGWLVLGASFIGWGLTLQQLVATRSRDGQPLLPAFWQGCAAVLAFLQLWHFVLPLGGGPALAAVAAVGGVGLWRQRRALHDRFRVTPLRKWLLWLALAILLAWVAHRSAGPCTLYDTGLYHMNAVHWAATYPIVPGLGNLHGRLACNNVGALLAASVECGPWLGRSQHVVNGLLVAGMFVLGACGLAHLWRQGGGRMRAGELFTVLLLLPAMVICLAPERDISSHSTDLPVWVLVLVTSAYLLELLGQPTAEARAPDGGRLFLLATSLLAAATCAKLSAGTFAVVAWALAAIVWLRRAERGRWLALAASLGLSAALIGPWLVRSVLLSGYPLYPAVAGGLDLDWSIPAEKVRADAAWIWSWAAAHSGPDQLQPWTWFGPWLARTVSDFEIVLLPLILGLVGLIAVLGRRRHLRGASGLWLLLPLALGFAAWVRGAPDARFALHLFYALGLLLLSIGTAFALGDWRWGRSVALPLCVALALVPIGHRTLAKAGRGGSLARALVSSLVRPAGPVHGFYPLPRVEFCERATASGLRVQVPCTPTPDGTLDVCSWDGPLLSTPYYDPALRLRQAPQIRHGFTVRPGPTVAGVSVLRRAAP